MHNGWQAGFCVDVYADVSSYVESYEYIEGWDGRQAEFCVDVDAYVQ